MVESAGDWTDVPPEKRADAPAGERSRVESLPTLRVPRTPEGVATAITHAASAPRTTGPGRSDPDRRDHPPLLAFGEREVPAVVRDRTPETGVNLRVPADYGDLYVTAPLAYYLGATVTAEESASAAHLTAPRSGVDHRFPTGPDLASEVAGLLRSVFFLDCLAREPDDAAPAGGVDLPAYANRPMAGRLAAVLADEFDGLDDRLPDWHLSTYVDPDPHHALALPYLLDAVSLVYPPSASELDGRGLLKRSLDDFFRSSGIARGDVATAARLDPDLRPGVVHAWLADGIPIAASKATVRAYQNRLRHDARPSRRLGVDVVINDREMHTEGEVADIYARRAADLPVEVRVHESLSRRELRRVFESPTDFVHYVGHCEVDGLRCSDGHLPTSTVDVAARTFFLNACGSFAEGLALVEGGAAAGAVTLTKVLNEQAATVGTGFARLLVHGFGIERALSLARRQILMGTDYAVVGDGTYSLTSPPGDPAVCHVAGGPDEFTVRWEVVDSRAAGRTYASPFDGERRPYGAPTERTLTATELPSFLAGRDVPVVYDGDLRSTASVVAELRD